MSQADKLREALEDVRKHAQRLLDTLDLVPVSSDERNAQHELREAIGRARDAEDALAEPREDVVSMPREPTREMLDLARKVFEIHTNTKHGHEWDSLLDSGLAAAYRSMVTIAAEGREHGK